MKRLRNVGEEGERDRCVVLGCAGTSCWRREVHSLVTDHFRIRGTPREVAKIVLANGAI